VVIEGKGLTLVPPVIGSGPGLKPKVGPIEVVGLPEGSQVLVRGLALSGTGPTFFVHDSLGAVRAEDCTFSAQVNYDHLPPQHAVEVESARDVSLVRCTLSGGAGAAGVDVWPNPVWPTSGAASSRVSGSTAAFLECTLTGGKGGTPWADVEGEYGMSGGAGGAGLLVMSQSSVTVSGSTLKGAGGGGFTCTQDGCGQPGEPGFAVEMPFFSMVLLHDSSVSSGDPLLQHPIEGYVQQSPGEARSLVVTATTFPGSTVVLEARGLPGDLLLAFASPHAAELAFPPGVKGVILLEPPVVLGPYVFPPVVAEDTPVTLALAAPGMASLVEGYSLLFQAFTLEDGGDVAVTSASTLTVVRP
jgi:hypothetical protein